MAGADPPMCPPPVGSGANPLSGNALVQVFFLKRTRGTIKFTVDLPGDLSILSLSLELDRLSGGSGSILSCTGLTHPDLCRSRGRSPERSSEVTQGSREVIEGSCLDSHDVSCTSFTGSDVAPLASPICMVVIEDDRLEHGLSLEGSCHK